jgi:mannose-6-phosphate isomerase-like protein (cupin superfamily)
MAYQVERWREMHKPNVAMLRQIMAAEGFRVYQWCDQPNMMYGMHMHAEDQSHWIISGSLELRVLGSGTSILEAGDRDFMPAGTYHSARVIGEEPVVYLIGEKIEKPKRKKGKSKK